jgi:tRNA(fMet)-specific endonuclease VapC
MIYALDTNIISYILRSNSHVKTRWRHEESLGNQAVIPLIVYMDVAARIYAECKKLGYPIEDADLLIAAQALSRDYVLVTNNTKHFQKISGLRLVNWVES